MSNVTRILQAASAGDPRAGAELLPLVYDELALEKFAVVDAPKAELVKLRYFVGLTFEETAEVLGIAVPTAKQWWSCARGWLRVERAR